MASLLFGLKKASGFLAGFAYIGAGLCALIAMSVFTAYWSAATFGWSFYLGWVGMIFAGISGILAFVLEKRGTHERIG